MSEKTITAEMLENIRRFAQVPGDFPNHTVVDLLNHIHQLTARNADLQEKQRMIDICQGQGLEHRIAAEKRAEAAEAELARRDEPEPVTWGAPKSVAQLISQLRTLDPNLETTAVLRMPKDFRDGNAIRAVPLSISYEKFDGHWLSPYKGDGRKVLVFWAKPDDRNESDKGEFLTAAPEPGVSDHVFRELVNELRDIAVKYHGTQQLRAHIAKACRAAMLKGGAE